MTMSPLSKVTVLSVISLLCYLTFSNSLNNSFMMDDHELILADAKAHDMRYILRQFTPGEFLSQPAGGLQTYRPLQYIVLRVFYVLFRDNPLGYHCANLILFIFACFSIYVLLKKLQFADDIALMATFFYCTHPINGMMVNYNTASNLIVQVLLFVGTILSSVRFYETKRVGTFVSLV